MGSGFTKNFQSLRETGRQPGNSKLEPGDGSTEWLSLGFTSAGSLGVFAEEAFDCPMTAPIFDDDGNGDGSIFTFLASMVGLVDAVLSS